MKYLLSIVSLVVIAACSKSSSTLTNNNGLLANTNWELRKSTGGIAGTIDYVAGNGQIIHFLSTDSFQIKYSTTTPATWYKGIYSVGTAYTNGDFPLYLNYNYNGYQMIEHDSITLSNIKLIFNSKASIVDGATLHYQKL